MSDQVFRMARIRWCHKYSQRILPDLSVLKDAQNQFGLLRRDNLYRKKGGTCQNQKDCQ